MKGGPSPPRPTSLHGVWVSPEHPLGPASQPTAPPSPIVPCSMDKLLGLGPILSLLPPPTWLGGDLFVVGNPSLVWEEWGGRGASAPGLSWMGRLRKDKGGPPLFCFIEGVGNSPGAKLPPRPCVSRAGDIPHEHM